MPRTVLSLANGVTGALKAATLGIHAIGRRLAAAQGLNRKQLLRRHLLEEGSRRLNDGHQRLEDEVLGCLKALLPEGVRATIIADRGFGDKR